MEWYSMLILVLVLVQAALIFYLWRKVDLIESERRVEAHWNENLQRQISALQQNLKDVALLAKDSSPVLRPTLPPVLPAVITGASPYSQAMEMFKLGISIGDVAERCGISRSEAELILSLYRNSPTS